MLRTKGFTRSYTAHFGCSEILDEDWDDYQPPQLTLATCFEQYEGDGRNGLPVGGYLHTSNRAYVRTQPIVEVRVKRAWWAPVLVEARIPSPLHPFCMSCGWRMGGPGSWGGHTCKCGYSSPPLRSHTGAFYYGEGNR